MKNPALRSEVRYEPAQVIQLKENQSILEWLEERGRLIPREPIPSKLDSKDEEEVYDEIMNDEQILEEEDHTDEDNFSDDL